MKEVRGQRAAVRNQRVKISRRGTERFLCALCSSVVKPISDIRVLISGLCAMLFALSLPVAAQQPGRIQRRAGFKLLRCGTAGADYAPSAFRGS